MERIKYRNKPHVIDQLTRPQMGLYTIWCDETGSYYADVTHDLQGTINCARFRLALGVHPNRELQEEWTLFGAEHFSFEVAEALEYDPDDPGKTDYSEELAALRTVWMENHPTAVPVLRME